MHKLTRHVCPNLQGANTGSRTIAVSSTAKIAVGQWVRILQSDPGDGSLIFELQGKLVPVAPVMKGEQTHPGDNVKASGT